MAAIDVLIPTCDRAPALATTLATLLGQTFTDFRIIIADQSQGVASMDNGSVRAVVRVLQAHGRPVLFLRNLPRRGLAQQRQFLLEHAKAPSLLYLDDDVLVETDLLERLTTALNQAGCGFVGSAVIGLSYQNDHRPDEQCVEFWQGPVLPEHIVPGSVQWQRHRLHNAANLWHVQRAMSDSGAPTQRLYKVAWVGGCVLYDSAKLRACGGFTFWRRLPREHCGEDVLAQIRVMARYGGCGLMPSGAYHQELATTVRERSVDAPFYLAALDQ